MNQSQLTLLNSRAILVTVQFVEQHSLNVTKATCIDKSNAKYLNISASIIAPILTHSV